MASPGRGVRNTQSADLASALRRAGLIDEYQLTVVPVVLGDGKPLFQNMRDRANMKLIQSKALRSGCIQLHYQPASSRKFGANAKAATDCRCIARFLPIQLLK
ncbi:dihydrofolate reductase family protein [Cohnella nanjingensis]|uniref:Dihydrofolate reductase family protein n=1 Tax=Cohnella nanjingensis TaxID=1387779 RepID=A0A7X0RQ30_9BACL|nr:dihydrofolate reductase family protein [Cohnella nanjingensis]